MINVTQPYLPSEDKYIAYVKRIYQSKWLTNNGPLVRELEARLTKYLGVKHLILVANGSIALQIAYRALALKGEVITTPFSFVATPNTLIWQNCKPIFADIHPDSFNLNADLIEEKITDNTSAIVPVHVFGNPCDVEKIASIGKKHNLPIIYDAAHAFGVEYKQNSILNFGDISTLSFHATKLFHAVEGGAIIVSDDQLALKIRKLINFGMASPSQIEHAGINGKMNEFEAAMGLCVLDDIKIIHEKRQAIWNRYYEALSGVVTFQQLNYESSHNYAYVPIVFDDEKSLLYVEKCLNQNEVFPRRYFYPSLDCLEYINVVEGCSISQSIASRILCLPIYPDLTQSQQDYIIKIILNNISLSIR